jgi:hypothetical protein
MPRTCQKRIDLNRQRRQTAELPGAKNRVVRTLQVRHESAYYGLSTTRSQLNAVLLLTFEE